MLGTFQAFFIWLFIRSNMDKSIENLYLHTYLSESNKQISQNEKRGYPGKKLEIKDRTRKKIKNISAFP